MPTKAKDKPESTRPETFSPDPSDPTGHAMIKTGPQPVDTEGYKGKYHKIGEPKSAEPYALKIVDADEASQHYDRTHHLINQEHFWTGSEAEFKQQFEKL
jgi:hypothetical protein